MKVFRLTIEENDGKEIRRVERSLSWREFEHLSVCARGQILDQMMYDLYREFRALKAQKASL